MCWIRNHWSLKQLCLKSNRSALWSRKCVVLEGRILPWSKYQLRGNSNHLWEKSTLTFFRLVNYRDITSLREVESDRILHKLKVVSMLYRWCAFLCDFFYVCNWLSNLLVYGFSFYLRYVQVMRVLLLVSRDGNGSELDRVQVDPDSRVQFCKTQIRICGYCGSSTGSGSKTGPVLISFLYF